MVHPDARFQAMGGFPVRMSVLCRVGLEGLIDENFTSGRECYLMKGLLRSDKSEMTGWRISKTSCVY